MTSLTLELSFRRAEVTAFWIVMTLAAGIVAWVAARAADVSWTWVLLGPGILAPGVIDRRWFEVGVAAWNKLVRIALPRLRVYVLLVCYYVLFGTIRLVGSTLHSELRADAALGVSRWVRHTASARPGVWALCLQPVLLLLAVLGDHDHPGGPPTGTYTLY